MVAPDESGEAIVVPTAQGYISHVMPNKSGLRADHFPVSGATSGRSRAARGSGSATAEKGGEEEATDTKERPPYSYARLAVMAISNLGGRAKVVEIYSWIQEQYPYYKNGTQYWKNCIRHNLSIKKFFQRSGPYWYYLPELDDMLESRKGSKQKVDGVSADGMLMRGSQNHHMTQLQLQAQMEQQQRYIDQHISRLQAMAQDREMGGQRDGPGGGAPSSSSQSSVVGAPPGAMGMPMGVPMGQIPMTPHMVGVRGHLPGTMVGGMPGQMGMPGQPVMMMPGLRPGVPMMSNGGMPPSGQMGQVMMDSSGRQFMAMPTSSPGFGVPREEAWSSLHQAAEILTNPAAREAYDQWRKSGVLMNKDDLQMRSRNPQVYKYDPSQQYDGMPLVPAARGSAPQLTSTSMAAPRTRKGKSSGRPARKALVKMSSDARPEGGSERLKRFQTDGPSGATKLRRVDSDGGSFLGGPAQALVPRSRVEDRVTANSTSFPNSGGRAAVVPMDADITAVPPALDLKEKVVRRVTFGPEKPRAHPRRFAPFS